MSKGTGRARLTERGSHVEAAVLDYLHGAARGGGGEHLLGAGAVARLEERVRDHYGAAHTLAVANATGGLFALALALELRGAEVVTTPLSWGGSLAGLLHAGARPVFADVDPVTLTLCPDAARRAITSRTRALLAVDLYGVPADHVALRAVADEYGLWYLHDAAQSLGAVRDGLPAGAPADAVVVSFTHGKALSTGEGGAVVTRHVDLHERLIWLTQHPHRQKRDLGLSLTNEFALNLRIHPLAAVWADADFEPALRRLKRRTRRADELVIALDASDVTEPLRYGERCIQPAYNEVTAAWRRRPDPVRLCAVLRDAGLAGEPIALGLAPLYGHAAFPKQLGASPGRRSVVAEKQAQRRFRLVGWGAA